MKTATQKQNALLYNFTLLKFWEVQSPPPPTIVQAGEMITNMIAWAQAMRSNNGLADDYKKCIVAQVREFFPDWDGESLKNRYFKKRYRNNQNQENSDNDKNTGNNTDNTNDHQSKETYQTDQTYQTEELKKKKSKKTASKPDKDITPDADSVDTEPKDLNDRHADPTINALLNRINAGLKNFYLVGPAGTGKTTICKMVAELLDMPCTILSCNSGTSPAEITGFKYPEPRPSAISQAIGVRGIVVFDEITMLDASVAASANALLANNEITTSTGVVVRDPDCIIIATANTIGDGGNRTYIGNNQLDAATLDRFVGGFLEVDYNIKYELENFDNEVCCYVHGLRHLIAENGFRRIASTRTIIACDKLKKAGLPWKSVATAQWSPEEIKTIGSRV